MRAGVAAMNSAAKAVMRACSAGESTNTRATPRDSSSRRMRNGKGRSSCTSVPGDSSVARPRTWRHSLRRYSMSSRRLSIATPCAAVRRM